MTQPVTVYRWDDVGAPQVVDGRPSEYIEIFKKCLVEGYGTKQPLGWTIAEESTAPLFIAFQNDTASGGTGGTLMLDAPSNAPSDPLKIQSALDFASRGSFSRPGFYFAIDAGSTNPDYTAKNWVIIGTATAFYMYAFTPYRANQNYQQTTYSPSFFAGDLHSLIPNDPGRFTAFTGERDNLQTRWSGTLNYKLVDASPGVLMKLYPADGGETTVLMTTSSIFGIYCGNGDSSLYSAEPEITTLCPLYVVANDSYSNAPTMNNVVSPYCRALLPGFFVSGQVGYRNVGYQPFTKAIDNQQYMQVPAGNSNRNSGLWINMEQW